MEIMKTIVRPMQESDIKEVHEIYSVAVLRDTTSFEIDPPTVSEIKTRWEKVIGLNLPYAVAEQNERVAGFAYVAPYRPRSAYRYIQWKIHSMWLHGHVAKEMERYYWIIYLIVAKLLV